MKKILFFLLGVCVMSFANDIDTLPKDLNGTKIIDVRGKDEWAKTGIIGGSITITFANSNGEVNPNFLSELKDANVTQDDNIIVVCKVGARSKMAQELLKKNGYKNVSNLTGGIDNLKGVKLIKK